MTSRSHRLLGLLSILSLLSLPAWAMAADSAEEMMAKAHHGRAVWDTFPGFQANIVAARDGKAAQGTVSVNSNGDITLKWRDAKNEEELAWVQRSLQSLVNHRLSDNAAITNVEFADEFTQHPMGRLIRSKEPAEKSLWRVKGDVLTEVHRVTDKSRMIISVAEVARTPEGKHLPRSFVTTTWNNDGGAIESSRQVFQEWKRIDGLDIPVRVTAMIATGDGQRKVEEIALTNAHPLPQQSKVTATISELPVLTVPVTSLGAAVADGHLYVFGGHKGSAHNYSADLQANQLLRLNLASPKAWEVVGETPRRTGTALVGYKNKLYRIGGWESKNAGGDKWNLFSSADFARFDPQAKKWEDLSPLPEGRSSHDAALSGSHLYLIGGWKLNGEGDGEWHDTAYVCNLDDAQPVWKAIAKPGFMRRALAVGTYQGKVYLIGGMDDSNDMTMEVSVYDPATDKWTKGPKLPGSGMDGFGASAISNDKGLFATLGNGSLLRLSDDGKAWEEVTKLKHPRFFHRLVADGDRLLVVGGTSRAGKTAEVEAIELK